MYGKLFKSVFTGSMVGSGAEVFAVWAYVVSNAEPPGVVELNPKVLAFVIGTSDEAVRRAIDYLMQPDPNSRNPEHEGRRLIHLGAYEYGVVSFDKYRKLQSGEDRREYMRGYMREYMRKRRDSNDASPVDDCLTMSNKVKQSNNKQCLANLAQAEAEAEVKKISITADADFDAFWAIYPKKVGKAAAQKAYARVTGIDGNGLIRAVERFKSEVRGREPKFIPHASTWLNGRRWEDEPDEPGEVEFRNGQATLGGFVA